MTYKRKDLAVQVNIKTDRGYTMHDIGQLDARISRLEYYTVLNALALDTQTTSVRDATGTIERFKNGIFADPFNDFTLSNIQDPEFSIAISSSQSIARPTFKQLLREFTLQPSTSTGVKYGGRLLTLDYTTEKFGGNEYATTYRNATESNWNFRGYCYLFPNFDNTADVTQGVPQNINIDIASSFQNLQNAGGLHQLIDVVSSNPTVTGTTTSTSGQTTTTTSTYSQTTTKTLRDISVNSSTVTKNVGDYVTDISTLYYMKARRVAVIARSMRPNTRMHFFFDKVAVDRYVVPAAVSPAYSDGAGGVDSAKAAGLAAGQQDKLLYDNGAAGTAVYSNSIGEVYAVFYIPANTFRTGDRVFTVTNVDNLSALGATFTSAEGTYTSSSLAITKSQLSYSVLQPIFTPTTTTETATNTWDVTTGTTIVNNIYNTYNSYGTGTGTGTGTGDGTGGTGDGTGTGGDGTGGDGSGGGDGGDPVAETFTIENRNMWDPRTFASSGAFLTSVGMFFKNKSSSLGGTMMVCTTTLGIPDNTKILGRKHLKSSEILISDDSSTETVFTFDNPILISTSETYAFYFIPDLGNPDYEFWISEVGGIDVLTGRAVTEQPYKGIMYVSNNAKSWSAIQSQDIKFNLYRARFTTTSGTAVFRNDKDDFLTVTNLLRSNTSVSIGVGSVVYAANSANTRQILTNTDNYPFGIIHYIDELNDVIQLDTSNGKFSNVTYKDLRIFNVPVVGDTSYLTYNGGYMVANCTLYTVDDPVYDAIVPKFNFLEPIGTYISVNYYGTSNSNNGFVKDTSPVQPKNEALYQFTDLERCVRSYSNEVAAGSYGANGSSTFVVNLKTGNQYLSPVVDIGVKTFNFIQNLINYDSTGENTKHGNAKNKYLSKNVPLNQTAEDIIVYVTGYRPVGTDIKAYVKFYNNADPDLFDSKDWTELVMSPTSLATTYSSPQNFEDYREWVFVPPTGNTVANSVQAYLDPNSTPADVLTYYDSQGTIHVGYDIFAIKLVLLSNNPVKLPTMRDVRAIALQK